MSANDTGLFDLNALVKRWALDMFYRTAVNKRQKKLKPDEIDLKFSWEGVMSWTEEPKFEDTQCLPHHKSHALFSTTFRNDTDIEQEYNFHTERSTRSTAEFEVSKGFTSTFEVGVKLQLPCQILEANTGFSRTVSLEQTRRQSVEEEQTWGVDTRVVVQPHKIAEASISILEDKLSSSFTCQTKMSGKLRVTCMDRGKNNAFLKYIEGDIGEIIKEQVNQPGGVKTDCVVTEKQPGTRDLLVTLTTKGKCVFRYGVKQVASVNQKPVPSAPA